MIHRKLYIALLLTLLAGACNKPEAKPLAPHSFAFDTASHKVAFTSGGTYTRAVVETNKPAGDARNIEYTSSNERIATVNEAGVVSFVTPGMVTITASKEAAPGLPEVTASYELTITKMKPTTKASLVTEIKRATRVHGYAVNLNYIDTSAITDMRWLFSNYRANGYRLEAFNGDISKWDVSGVTDMSRMFYGATSFNQNISGWNVAKVTNMNGMFQGATSFNQNIAGWNVAKVTNMNNMFFGATSFNQNIAGWNVAKVTDMNGMFQGATLFNQDISGWNVAKVTDMQSMFAYARAFTHNLDAWGSRINATLKANSWIYAFWMFVGSGLADNLPSWCKTTACKNQQVKKEYTWL